MGAARAGCVSDGAWKRRQMSRRLQLTSQRFGRLVAIRDVGGGAPNKSRLWRCRCECGTTVTVTSGHLRSGHTRSCGCLQRETIAATRRRLGPPNVTHGFTRRGHQHPLYKTWGGMWQRCTNPRADSFEFYGGRGITVCERWRDFTLFVADMGAKPSPRHSLDRIDNDGHYSCGRCEQCQANRWPANVRWATPSEQARNARVTPKRRAAASATMRNWNAKRARP